MVKSLHNDSTAGSHQVGPDDAFMRLFEMVAVLGEYMERGLTERGLTRARAWLIWQLHHHGPVTQRALSELLRVTPRNVTGLVDALEADGFVARTPHPTDRRATLVTLTQKGRNTASGLARDYQKGAEYLFGGVTPANLTALVDTLDVALARLPAAGPAGGGSGEAAMAGKRPGK